MYPRRNKIRRKKTVALGKRPQRKGICARVLTTSPKKPNSAARKIAKIKFFHPKLELPLTFQV
jgi:small subunit ribosomal protein S12